MAISNSEKTTPPANGFPYVKLIWPVFILLVLLIFKKPIETLLLGSDEVAVEVFGVKINVAQADIDELGVIQKQFEAEIEALNDTINQQNIALTELAKMNEELMEKSNTCPEIEEATRQFSKGVREIRRSSEDLKTKTNKFSKKQLFKIPKEEQAEKE
jgi:methyl-accepting chemotaxis protein